MTMSTIDFSIDQRTLESETQISEGLVTFIQTLLTAAIDTPETFLESLDDT